MFILRSARAWASRLSPETKENTRLVVQGAQFAAACYFVDQFLFDVSMVRPPRVRGRWSMERVCVHARKVSRRIAVRWTCTHAALPRVVAQTQGPSMLPTLNEMGDIVIVDRLVWNPIQRGDIVIAESLSRCVHRSRGG